MGRVNKNLEGVFIHIVGNQSEKSSYDQFLEYSNKLPKEPSEDLKHFIKMYNDMLVKVKSDIQRLADLEVIIMQMRSMENLTRGDIKLNVVRDEYIYARCPFYRHDNETKDIRIIVDNLEFWPQGIKNLYDNQEFMSKAEAKLLKAMEDELSYNIENFQKMYEEIYD